MSYIFRSKTVLIVMDQTRKSARTLDMYVRLCEGKIINKEKEAQRFLVDERSIQRDIDEIRAFLANHETISGNDHRTIVYDRTLDGFVLKGNEDLLMSNDEVLAVSKILLESRAFTKKEISSILDKLISTCVPLRNMKMISELISNEKYHYVELHHKADVIEKLWRIGEEIRQNNLLKITYQKQVASKEKVDRIVLPVAVIFSEFYFYLIAFIVENSAPGKYEKKYDYPAVFRLDRIITYEELGTKFAVPYSSRFEEGEFRKRVQFMFPGPLTKLQFRYTGRNLEAVLDRLPTAKVISKNNESVILEAEVYGNGILMWLLSQGKAIEILKPESLRDEIRQMLIEMLNKYK